MYIDPVTNNQNLSKKLSLHSVFLMEAGEASTPTKSSKPASSTQELPITPTTPAYPDWSSYMQAFYGTGATPSPFFASTVASHTPHPYMWGGQHPLMPPYGTPIPYPALYPPGGVYAHPNMAMVVCSDFRPGCLRRFLSRCLRRFLSGGFRSALLSFVLRRPSLVFSLISFQVVCGGFLSESVKLHGAINMVK